MLEEQSMFTNKETPVEKCKLGDTIIDIPQELCEQKLLFKEVLNYETWQRVLRNEHRAHLMKFLPSFPDQDAARKHKLIKDLFSGVNFKFGNPLDIFHKKLKDGFFSPDISKMACVLKNSKYQEYISQQQHYFYKLLQEILISRKRLLESCSQLPPDQPARLERVHARPKLNAIEHRTKRRYFRELQGMREEIGELASSSEDENYPEGGFPKMNKRQKKQSVNLESSINMEEGSVSSTLAPRHNVNGSTALTTVRSVSPFEVNDDMYRQLLQNYKINRSKHKSHPEFDISQININDVGARANISKRSAPKLNEQSNRKKTSKDKERNDKKKSSVPTLNSLNQLSVRGLENVTASPNDVALLKPKVEVIEDLDSYMGNSSTVSHPAIGINSSHQNKRENEYKVPLPRASSPMLTHSTVTSFFALLRDFMSKGSGSNFTIPKLEDKVKTWQDNPFSGLNDWCSSNVNWSEMVLSALEYLNGKANGTYPENFVSFVDHKDNSETWRWAGDYRDSDEILLPLAAHWMETRAQEEHVQVTDDCEPSSPTLPPPRVHTDWAVRKMTDEEKMAYRNQEKCRYENPHMAYTIAMHGYESVVGPVKGVYGKDTSMNKAREHSLLVSDRPPFVTILSLVRDAAARLPNGEGTRADICELLKGSQYLSPSTDAQIHTVVSGALDRLHYESDPCVKYDVNRKMWIYLHRNRSEEDYERIHQEQMAAAKAKKSVKPKSKPSKSKPSKTGVSNISSLDNSSSNNSECSGNPTTPVSTISTLPANRNSSTLNRQTIQPKTSKSANIPAIVSTLANAGLKLQEKNVSTVKEPVINTPFPKSSVVRNNSMSGSEMTTAMRKESSDVNHPTEPSINSALIITASSAGSSIDAHAKSLVSSSSLTNLAQVHLVGTTSTSTSLLSSSNKTSGATTVAQLTVTPTPKAVGAIMVQQAAAAAAAAAVKNVTIGSQGALKLVPSGIPHTAATIASSSVTSASIVTQKLSQGAIQGVPTIVFKQEGLQDPSIQNAVTASKPVVARIISPPQVVSVGNLIASTLAASQKHGKPIQGTTTIKIQGSNMIRSVGNKTSHINMVQTSTNSTLTSQHPLPRLTLVSQVPTSNLMSVTGTTVSNQQKFVTTPSQIGFVTSSLATQQQSQVSSITKPTILATQGGIKIVSTAGTSNANISQLSKSNHTVVVTTKQQTQTAVTVPIGTTSAASQNLILTSGMQPTAPAASQRTIKPATVVTGLMATGPSTPTVVMATQQNLRPLSATTVTPMNMKTIHGVKVIPVTQTNVGVKGKQQPVFARIITPQTNLTLRPTSATSMATNTSGPAIGVLHAVSQVANNRLHLGNQVTSFNSMRTTGSVPSSVAQATIIRIQGPSTTLLPPGIQDQTAKDSS